MYKFKGWIPTVSGCLSFSLFGENDYPRQAVSRNVANSDKRYIVCWQKRLLSDTVLPFKEIFSRHILKKEGAFWCVCIASSSNSPVIADDELTGTLYFFHGKGMWNPVKSILLEQQERLSSLNLHENDSDKNKIFHTDFCQFQDDLIGESSYFVNFSLRRNGVAEFVTPKNLNYLSKNAPRFPEALPERKHFTHLVCSQLFFFLKDIAHHHQHHAPSTDTMIDIYCSENDDYSWRCATLRILLRKVLEFKRSTDVDFLSSSLGILAYTNSFRTLSDKELEDNQKLSPDYNQETLEQSIKAAQEVKSISLQKSIRAQELFRSLFFSFLGVIFAIIGLVRLTEAGKITATPDRSIISVASFVVQNPLVSAILLIALILVGMIMFGAIDFTKWKSVRASYRVLQAYKRKISIGFLSMVTAISVYIVFMLILSIVS